jgi:hypothetical protein
MQRMHKICASFKALCLLSVEAVETIENFSEFKLYWKIHRFLPPHTFHFSGEGRRQEVSEDKRVIADASSAIVMLRFTPWTNC